MPRLPFINSTVSIKRRTTTTGNKKEDSTIQSGISAFISDAGTTSAQEQTYHIMINADDVTLPINPETDTINDGTNDYKIFNCAKKTYHYSLRCIKSI